MARAGRRRAQAVEVADRVATVIGEGDGSPKQGRRQREFWAVALLIGGNGGRGGGGSTILGGGDNGDCGSACVIAARGGGSGTGVCGGSWSPSSIFWSHSRGSSLLFSSNYS